MINSTSNESRPEADCQLITRNFSYMINHRVLGNQRIITHQKKLLHEVVANMFFSLEKKGIELWCVHQNKRKSNGVWLDKCSI